jgi:hypothetical protein
MNKTIVRVVVYSSVLVLIVLVLNRPYILVSAYQRFKGRRTVAKVIEKYGPGAEERLLQYFEVSGIAYPPERITIVALKEEKALELWGLSSGNWNMIRTYSILGASGTEGPKLKQGDLQVPEGFYRIAGLNPNSSYHLSMKLDYPNAFDLEQAKREGRDNLGGDIFIHGSTGSVGCLAMGDPAIEELFTIVEKVGRANTRVIISPKDFRRVQWEVVNGSPPWLPHLYAKIDNALREFKKN